MEQVIHQTINSRYKIIIERAAGVKTGDGFKVEANGDDIAQVEMDADELYKHAQLTTPKVEV